MTGSFYENAAFMRLAANAALTPPLGSPDGSAERRSPICGSRIVVDVQAAGDGTVAAVGMKVNACLVGQVAAHVMARAAPGRTADDIAAARDQIAEWLSGGETVPEWPGFDVLMPVRPKTARHAAILIAFEAAAQAAADARDRGLAR